ncbi:unnamed protein product [Kuraishia capsulata CBS 1993]|uniref:Transcriptional adapter 2 n=1 Tax=Kuraishia capsulata CBS 1993 TaxID=1382522 RepID=W6MJU0_9ASCO|nr:uncharacterized protein KUCA_T00000764001 [Kuraishia capsulata CBS 1993]CDK24797.1 unnamed protein product [Kuraishia capsulata CBS 1993]
MAKFHCDVCSSDCTRRVRIRCAICQEYDLCVPCFLRGESSGKHKPWHDYKIIEQHAYPIFSEDWGADEELLLIEGAQTFGLGNWLDISDHIGDRSKEEVGKHYRDVYLKSPDYPIPDLGLDFSYVTTDEFLNKRRQRIESKKNLPLPPPKKPLSSVPLCSDIQKYMPGRLEFEEEADDEAEKNVADMVFDPDDPPQDNELKLTILDIYNSKLTMRAERKRLMLQDGLLEYRKNIANDKKKSKEEKELYTKIKAFARVMTTKDFEEFSEDMLAELRCRAKIQQLQEWRANGITNMEQGSKYEKDKIARQALLQKIGFGSSGASRHTANSMASAGMRGRIMSHTGSPAPSLNGEIAKRTTKNIVPLDISHAADYELLSNDERILCSTLRIYPKPYLVIKELLFRELLRTGGVLKKRTARELLKIDVNKTSKIYEFFVQQKWCNATS